MRMLHVQRTIIMMMRTVEFGLWMSNCCTGAVPGQSECSLFITQCPQDSNQVPLVQVSSA